MSVTVEEELRRTRRLIEDIDRVLEKHKALRARYG